MSCRPADRGLRQPGGPNRGVRFLHRPDFEPGLGNIHKPALVRKRVLCPGPDHGLVGLVKDLAALLMIDLPRNKLARLNAPTDAPQQTSVTHHIQHRTFFG